MCRSFNLGEMHCVKDFLSGTREVPSYYMRNTATICALCVWKNDCFEILNIFLIALRLELFTRNKLKTTIFARRDAGQMLLPQKYGLSLIVFHLLCAVSAIEMVSGLGPSTLMQRQQRQVPIQLQYVTLVLMPRAASPFTSARIPRIADTLGWS